MQVLYIQGDSITRGDKNEMSRSTSKSNKHLNFSDGASFTRLLRAY